jgi:hypothetical protein
VSQVSRNHYKFMFVSIFVRYCYFKNHLIVVYFCGTKKKKRFSFVQCLWEKKLDAGGGAGVGKLIFSIPSTMDRGDLISV